MQGMYVLCNVASGNEFHKEGVMKQLFPRGDDVIHPFVVKFLQSDNSQLRIAAVWAIINLTLPSSPRALDHVTKLRNAGIVSQIKNMVNDPCLDVKVISIYHISPTFPSSFPFIYYLNTKSFILYSSV